MSDNQYLIEKSESTDKTVTTVQALDEKGKLSELVRLLGGNKQDEFALKHAQELLSQAQNYKKSL